MNLKLVSLLLLIALISARTHKRKYMTKIMNGNEAKKHFPWVAAIYTRSYNFETKIYSSDFLLTCGGTILTKKFILTAAHCVFHRKEDKKRTCNLCPLRYGNIPPCKMKVVVGHFNLEADMTAELLSVKRITYYPLFQQCTLENDLALLELVLSLHLERPLIKSIGIASQWVSRGQGARVAGWGMRCLDNLQEDVEARLKLSYIDIPVVHGNHCQAFNILHSRFICAGSTEKSAQKGDSGGGLWVEMNGKPKLVGISSTGFNCTNTYNVYTRLSFYRDWVIHRINTSRLYPQHRSHFRYNHRLKVKGFRAKTKQNTKKRKEITFV